MNTESTEQKWPEHLVIVRHGQSARNLAKDLASKSGAHSTFGSGLRDMDEPLTETGRQQASAAGIYLASRYKFDVVFTSPYVRAVQTSDEILRAFPKGAAVERREERLREIDFGILDGLTAAGIRAQYMSEWERRQREGKYWYRPPGGENRPDVALRVQSFLGTLTRDYRRKSVLIVCHSVVVLIFRRLLERWGETEYLKTDKENDVLNCGITAYRFDHERQKLELEMYNQTHY